MKHWIWIGLALAYTAGLTEDLTSEQQAELIVAVQGGDYDTVLRLTEELPVDHDAMPARAGAFQRRGEERFFDADIEGAISDFDAFLALMPDQDPYHWQRGLAYYYAERYADGKAQFERHQAVNSRDVENAVWHFICAARSPEGNFESAREGLIPIEGDSRVPMKQIHDLFAGVGSVEQVLEAAAPDDDGELDEEEITHLCYAHLYLGLYFEALGEAETAAKHIRLAAFEYPISLYMGKTAVVHAKVRDLRPE